jgi:hypothetical protein
MMKTVTKEEMDALLTELDDQKAARTAKMPTERDALLQMFEARQRLEELGWRDAIYCPKDGSEFSAIEFGSTGVHLCTYSGEWPTGSWLVHDGDTCQ